MVICLERGADLHMAQLMPLPLTFSCFSKIQIGFTILVPAHLGSPGQRAIKRIYVCMYLVIILHTVGLHQSRWLALICNDTLAERLQCVKHCLTITTETTHCYRSGSERPHRSPRTDRSIAFTVHGSSAQSCLSAKVISIGWAVFAGLTVVTNTQTDGQTTEPQHVGSTHE